MLSVRTRVTVKEDGTVEARLTEGELPPGETYPRAGSDSVAGANTWLPISLTADSAMVTSSNSGSVGSDFTSAMS